MRKDMISKEAYMKEDHSSDKTAEKAHRAYYGQFVNDNVKKLVIRTFGKSQLQESLAKDFALNNIPLQHWESLVKDLPGSVSRQLREAGDWLSLGNGVCVLKEAARQVCESQNG